MLYVLPSASPSDSFAFFINSLLKCLEVFNLSCDLLAKGWIADREALVAIAR